jgi:hypothetical protein
MFRNDTCFCIKQKCTCEATRCGGFDGPIIVAMTTPDEKLSLGLVLSAPQQSAPTTAHSNVAASTLLVINSTQKLFKNQLNLGKHSYFG